MRPEDPGKGEWFEFTDEERAKHRCPLPTIWTKTTPEHHGWRCECGRAWELRRNSDKRTATAIWWKWVRAARFDKKPYKIT